MQGVQKGKRERERESRREKNFALPAYGTICHIVVEVKQMSEKLQKLIKGYR